MAYSIMCKKLFVRVFLLFELYANEFEARFFWPTRYLTKSSVVICTENLFSSLTSGINLVSIGRQMPPQGSLLSVRVKAASFLGNRVDVVILAAMGQYTFLLFLHHFLFSFFDVVAFLFF